MQLSLQDLFFALQAAQLMHHFSQLLHVYLHRSALALPLGLVHLGLHPHARVVDTLLVALLLAQSLGRHLYVFGAVVAVLLDQLDGIILQYQ